MSAYILINTILDYYKSYKCYLFNTTVSEILSPEYYNNRCVVSVKNTISIRLNNIIISNADWNENMLISMWYELKN